MRGKVMEDLVEKFIELVAEEFKFLENDYGYTPLGAELKHPEEIRDATISVRYLGATVGVLIQWEFISARIGVAFVEISNNKFPEKVAFWGDFPERARAIDLNTLAKYRNKGDISEFLLGDVNDMGRAKERAREKENMF